MAREMERRGLHAAAAHRRRHHQQGAHRGQDRARLPPPGGPRARRLAGGRRWSGALKSAGSRAEPRRQNRREQEQPARAARGRSAEASRCCRSRRRGAGARRWTGRATSRRGPSFTGVRAFDAVPLAEIVPFIDWSPFFQPGSCAGTYPRIFENPTWGARARELFDDAQAPAASGSWTSGCSPPGRCTGFFPAQRAWATTSWSTPTRRGARVLATFHTLRQQTEQAGRPAARRPWPTSWPRARPACADYLGAFAVTAGHRARARWWRSSSATTTTTARSWPRPWPTGWRRRWPRCCTSRRARGVGLRPRTSTSRLRRADPRALPRHPARARLSRPVPTTPRSGPLFDLLEAEERAGIHLTESFAMTPPASVCGLYFSHPEARYFTVGRIGATRSTDYARRKGLDVGRGGALAGAQPGLRAGGGRRRTVDGRPTSRRPRTSEPVVAPHHRRAGPPPLRAARHPVGGRGVPRTRAASAASWRCGWCTGAARACSGPWCGACWRARPTWTAFADAPPQSGGWGATLVELVPLKKESTF